MAERASAPDERFPAPVRVGLDLRILQGPGAVQGIGTYLSSLATALFRVTSEPGARFRIVPFALPGKPFLRSLPEPMPSAPEAIRRPAREIRIVSDLLNQALTPFEVLASRVALFHSPSPYDLAFFYPIPLVVTVHDLAPLAHPEWVLRTGVKHAFLYRFVRRARRIVAVSEFTRGEIVMRLGIPAGRVTVVPEAAASPFQAPVDPARAAETASRLGLDAPFVLFVAGFRQDDPRKNAVAVVDAFARLLSTHPALKLGIAGAPGAGAEPVQRRIRALGIGSKIVWTGFVPDDDLASLYSACEAFLFPTLYEGFGLPVLEAMGCGAVVVTARSGAVPEVAGEAVLYADPLEPADIAARVRQVLDDGDLRRSLRERGRTRAREYSWEIAARRTLDAYAEALGLAEGTA